MAVSAANTSIASYSINVQISNITKTSFGILLSVGNAWSAGNCYYVAVGH